MDAKNENMYYTLTAEDIQKANTYVPSTIKMAFIKAAAERCFDRLDITTNNGKGGTNSPLPSCYKVDTDKKSRYLMGALVKLYLVKDFEPESEDDTWLMNRSEYDMYAGGHLIEQFRRLKSNPEIKDKCYDIIADYSELKHRLESDINGLLTAMNDPASRLLAYVEMSSSPEEMKKALDEMAKNQEILDEYKNNRDEHIEELMASNTAIGGEDSKGE